MVKINKNKRFKQITKTAHTKLYTYLSIRHKI